MYLTTCSFSQMLFFEYQKSLSFTSICQGETKTFVHHWTRKPGWTNAKALPMSLYLWVALKICNVNDTMGSKKASHSQSVFLQPPYSLGIVSRIKL